MEVIQESELNQAFLVERRIIILHREVNMLHKQPVDI